MKLNEIRSKIVPDDADVSTLVRQAKRQKEYKLIGNHLKKVDGGKIWKINKETRVVSEALYRVSEEITLAQAIGGIPPEKIDIEPGHWYVEALNAKNATKKLEQGNIILST